MFQAVILRRIEAASRVVTCGIRNGRGRPPLPEITSKPHARGFVGEHCDPKVTRKIPAVEQRISTTLTRDG
jgi:hypothetical protein